MLTPSGGRGQRARSEQCLPSIQTSITCLQGSGMAVRSYVMHLPIPHDGGHVLRLGSARTSVCSSYVHVTND